MPSLKKQELLQDKIMTSWKDGVGLICFIIVCIRLAENQPDKFFSNYHKMPC